MKVYVLNDYFTKQIAQGFILNDRANKKNVASNCEDVLKFFLVAPLIGASKTA
jgi:hypothetical protein